MLSAESPTVLRAGLREGLGRRARVSWTRLQASPSLQPEQLPADLHVWAPEVIEKPSLKERWE